MGRRHSFRYKLFLALTMLILLTVGIFGFLIYNYFYEVLKKQVIQDQRQTLEQFEKHIEYVQDTMQMTAQSIAVREDIQDAVRGIQEKSTFENLVTQKEIRSVLGSFVMLQPYFEDIAVVTRGFGFYTSNNTGVDFTEEDWYLEAHNKGGIGYSRIHYYYNEQGQSNNRVISFIVPFKDLQQLKTELGEVIVHLNLEKVFSEEDIISSSFAVFDGNGEILCGDELSVSMEEITRSTDTSLVTKDHNIIIFSKELSYGWIVAKEIPASYIAASVVPMIRLLWIFLIFLILVMLIGFSIVLFRYTKPISELAHAAEEVGKGNFDIDIQVNSNDEFYVLGKAFQKMVINIQELLASSVAYEKKNKEIEINRLMLQINPHFIYNTLNSIVYMAKLKRDDDIILYTNAFISLLQETLKTDASDMYTSFTQEIKNIKNYVALQSLRYPDKIQAIYEVDDQVLPYAVPNMLLQPIVENAIYHGLALKPEGGSVWIRCRLENDSIYITVADDGVGMSQEKIKQILARDEGTHSEYKKIGIVNVRDRVTHIYGAEYGVSIKSEAGLGTEVMIHIPCVALSDNS